MSTDDPAGWRASAEQYGALARDGAALGMDDLAGQAAELAARHGLRWLEWYATDAGRLAESRRVDAMFRAALVAQLRGAVKCPECGGDCERDEVDNGVGMQAAGPLGCPCCHWVEQDKYLPGGRER
jgi:hypothetical protein